jgi:shikimate kinase
MKIYLLGYMGCGKSTIGKKLAARLSCGFIDLDGYIEQREGRSISEMFEQKGETAFREYEHAALLEVSQMEKMVVATGGGTPCFENNLELINKTGTSIYLEMEAATLVNRIWNAKTSRPLVRNMNKEELMLFVKGHLQSRQDFYRKAHYTINAKGLDIGNLVSMIGGR